MALVNDKRIIAGTLSSAGANGITDWFPPVPLSQFNNLLSMRIVGTTGGFTGTVVLQRAVSPDSTEGSTWENVDGESYTDATDKNIEPGPLWIYRLKCIAISAGTIDYAITR